MRLVAVAIVALGVAVLGYLVTLLPGQDYPAASTDGRGARRAAAFEGLVAEPAGATGEAAPQEAQSAPPDDLAEARSRLAAGEYDRAIEHLTAVRERVRDRPEAYLLVGLALLGKHDHATAYDFFRAAIDRDPALAEAYFGMAVAAEGLGDLEHALGGMRIFLHLQTDPDPYRLKVAQARSAIWEWETRLGRGEWGPTRGIPPGFTAEELERDGRGVGTKVPIPGTENEHGFSRYTIKYSDRIQTFEK